MTGESGFDVEPATVNRAADGTGIGWVSAEVVDFGLKFGGKLGVGVGVFDEERLDLGVVYVRSGGAETGVSVFVETDETIELMDGHVRRSRGERNG